MPIFKVKTDLKIDLLTFKNNHSDLNSKEIELLDGSMFRLDETNISQEKEKLTIITELRTLSLEQNLSNDGQKLLKKLQSSQWLDGLFTQLPFFR